MLRYWINLGRRIADFWRPYRKRAGVVWDALNMRAKLSFLFAGLILAMTAFFYIFAIYQTTREIKIGAIYKGQAIRRSAENRYPLYPADAQFSQSQFDLSPLGVFAQ